jgi:NAD+ synthase
MRRGMPRDCGIEFVSMSRPELLAGWMRRQLASAGSRGFIVGLSGGVDSAVVLRLAQLAAPHATLGMILPCHSDPRDEEDAAMVASHFSAPVQRIDLSDAYDALMAPLQPALRSIPNHMTHAPAADRLQAHLPIANVKPRLRMTAMYFAANSLGYLVAGASNRAELAVGYFTKYGDGAADVLPLARLLKSEVRALARELGVPARIADRPASAGLWIGQSDEEEMGFTYVELERYLQEGPQAVSPALAMKIERLMRASEHKRRLPAVPDSA